MSNGKKGIVNIRVCRTIEEVSGKTCILDSYVPKGADKDYAKYMRQILDENIRMSLKIAEDHLKANSSDEDARKTVEKYRCTGECVLYFYGTISVDGYCETGVGEQVSSGRLVEYKGDYCCVEIKEE